MRRVSFRAMAGAWPSAPRAASRSGARSTAARVTCNPSRDAVGGLAAKREVERVGGPGDGGGGHRGVDVRRIGVGEEQRERGSEGCIVHDGSCLRCGGQGLGGGVTSYRPRLAAMSAASTSEPWRRPARASGRVTTRGTRASGTPGCSGGARTYTGRVLGASQPSMPGVACTRAAAGRAENLEHLVGAELAVPQRCGDEGEAGGGVRYAGARAMDEGADAPAPSNDAAPSQASAPRMRSWG